MTRILLDVAGLIAIAAGAILLPLPLPFGAPLILIGFIVLTISEKWVRRWVRSVRKKHPTVNRMFLTIAQHVPHVIARAIQESEPQ